MKKYMQMYSEATKRIEETWLWDRAKIVIGKSRKNIPNCHVTHLSPEDVGDFFNEMDWDWYFKLLPDELKQRFTIIKNSIVSWNSSVNWNVDRDWINQIVECDLYDWLLLSWLYSSLITTPEEVRDFSKLWFSSSSDLIITISAYIINLLSSDNCRWYEWSTEYNGHKYITRFDQNTDRDFELNRFDITEYNSINFCWDISSVRPRSTLDIQNISWSYGTEFEFLACIIRWIIQCNIKSNILEWWFEWILELLNNKSFFENEIDLSWFESTLDGNDKSSFGCFDIPITSYWKKVSSHYWVQKHHWWKYLALVKWDELVFTNYDSWYILDKNPVINCSIYPSEADELLKWIIIRAYKERGRVSVYQILALYSYFFENKDKILKWQL